MRKVQYNKYRIKRSKQNGEHNVQKRQRQIFLWQTTLHNNTLTV